MTTKRHHPHLEHRAKTIFLEHRSTDEAIAAEIGADAATVAAWRIEGDWEFLAKMIDERVNAELSDVIVDRRIQMDRRHDSLAAALEGAAVRAIRKATTSGKELSPAEIRALAGTLAITQTIRRQTSAASETPESKRPSAP